MHSKDKLANALRRADLPKMAERAEEGYYHDFLSPLATPDLQLDDDLLKAATPAALALRLRHHNGDFDATLEEGEAWAASPEGKEVMAELVDPKRHQIGRLAMRTEGKYWIAYYAPVDTMEGAIQLGSIAMAAVQGDDKKRERKQEFMAMMRDIVSDIIEESTGIRPEWPEPEGHSAPEHERAGRA